MVNQAHSMHHHQYKTAQLALNKLVPQFYDVCEGDTTALMQLGEYQTLTPMFALAISADGDHHP